MAASAVALETVTEGEACMSWAEHARASGTTPLSAAAGTCAAAASVAIYQGCRRNALQRAAPKRQLPRWGEVAFAFR